MERVLVLSFTDLASDSRIRRQLRFLRSRFEVVALAAGTPGIQGTEFRSLAPWLRRYRGTFGKALRFLGKELNSSALMTFSSAAMARRLVGQPMDDFALILANDTETLPLAFALRGSRSTPILLDAHEMEHWNRDPNPQARRPSYRAFRRVQEGLIRSTDAIVSVSPGIVDHYAVTYGKRCSLVTNAPFFADLSPSSVDRERVTLVHHGNTNATRGLGSLLRLIELVDNRFELHLLLMKTDAQEYDRILNAAAADKRVHVHPPVPSDEIAMRINQYDIGIHMMNPSVRNQELALPNKLFEFVQARLCLAVWPLPEMATLVRRHDLGIVSRESDLASMASALNGLTSDDISRYKRQVHDAAMRLSAEENQETMIGAVESCLRSRV